MFKNLVFSLKTWKAQMRELIPWFLSSWIYLASFLIIKEPPIFSTNFSMILLKIKEKFLIDRLTLPFAQDSYSWTNCVVPPTHPDCHNLNLAISVILYRNLLALYYAEYIIYKTLLEFLSLASLSSYFKSKTNSSALTASWQYCFVDNLM